MIKAIEERRSIRKYKATDISREVITEIIESGMKAPSAKNRQPWKFIVVQGNAKKEMLAAFQNGIQREEETSALLPNSHHHMKATKFTVDIMTQAPVIILVVNTEGKGLFTPLTSEERIYEAANIQSVSAAIQNMLLAATEKGLGSLWICDIFFGYEELCQWLGAEGELLAAIALGVPDENPKARPRKKMEDVVLWRK